jgi:hypothetical protein
MEASPSWASGDERLPGGEVFAAMVSEARPTPMPRVSDSMDAWRKVATELVLVSASVSGLRHAAFKGWRRVRGRELSPRGSSCQCEGRGATNPTSAGDEVGDSGIGLW